jgi:hypothetical protein
VNNDDTAWWAALRAEMREHATRADHHFGTTLPAALED